MRLDGAAEWLAARFGVFLGAWAIGRGGLGCPRVLCLLGFLWCIFVVQVDNKVY
jgi:hypothetical protein